MAFSDTLALYDDAGTPVSHDFVRVGLPSGGQIKRLDSATTLSSPRFLILGHATSKPKTGSVVNRHLASTRWDKPNSVSNLVSPLIVNVTFQIPQDTTFVSQDVYDGYKILDNFLTHANIDKMLRGEL
jgi:hypothetical protein